MSIDGITPTTNDMTMQQSSTPDTKKMGKDEFLKLLVTQLKHQDPMKPMDNKEFIAQTAQFTSMEQMTNMNKNLEQFLGMQRLTQASSLIGKEVKLLDSDSGVKIKGQVDKVVMGEDSPKVVVDGTKYNIGAINEVLG